MPKNKNKKGKQTSTNDAEGLKNKGNVAFQNGKMEEAIDFYSQAIELDNTNAVFFSNRANVYIALEQFGKAIEDAESAINVNPQFTKAYLRKALALYEMPQVEGSVQKAVETIDQALASISEEDQAGAHKDFVIELQKLKAQAVKEVAEDNILSKDDPERMRFQALLDWMVEDGAEFEKMKLRFYDKNYRGVHMARPCKKGETILYVPLKEIITLEMCMESPTGSIMYQLGHRHRLISPKHSFFSTFLMEEKRKENSYWDKYIDILPKSFEAYPIFYNQEELAWLENTHMVHMVQTKIEDMRKDYDVLCKEVSNYSEFPFEEYQQMRLLVASRIFGIDVDGKKTDGFVPYADMLNHKRPRETSWTYCNERKGFIIEALVDLERGQPVHDSYGRKSNTRFLLNYGFINFQNDANDLPMSFSLKANDPLALQKMQLLQSNRPKQFLTMGDYEEEVTSQMMSYLRFIEYQGPWEKLQTACDSAQEELKQRLKNHQGYISDSDEDLDPQFKGENLRGIDYATEKKVHERLFSMYSEHLKAYPTTIEQDREILKQELSMANRNACDFRLGEKVICDYFVRSSALALGLMKMKKNECVNQINKLPVEFEGMRYYIVNILLPLIAQNNG